MRRSKTPDTARLRIDRSPHPTDPMPNAGNEVHTRRRRSELEHPTSNGIPAGQVWSMRRFIVPWREWCLVIILTLCMPFGASAQDKHAVEAGKTSVLVDVPASAPISATSAERGHSEIKASADGKRSTLVYTAPPFGITDDIVKYTAGGLTKTIAISITDAEATGQRLTDAATYEPAFKILFAIFVLALLLESGLAVLFNWRPFVMTFDARGVKTLVSLAFSLFFVLTFQLDLCAKLIGIRWHGTTTLAPPATSSPPWSLPAAAALSTT